ncbi:MAG: hypothetical protein A3A33_02185 [Candidatus Yanofskybacteria bacterium RIFCSPLOWO2_01_FULL_49_25]|uniref:DUF5667 domain-containing protein n=1 Tax=Candidatus Yanofskybacteria bacterium RIFCSPLOWO2_01_FULL_49_25 TaxID=1802701 RepID=A0A1F8GS83_9BACT|nr:MAG: hypothetical protein A3A33_02185 [Candidatus Yanofskybacteria bacterium RIFCSPLOWO2_01_FULL_49_25]
MKKIFAIIAVASILGFANPMVTVAASRAVSGSYGNALENLRKIRNDSESSRIRSRDARDHAVFLKKQVSLEQIIILVRKHLETIQANINNNRGITANLKTSIMRMLDDISVRLDNLMQETKNAATVEDLKKLAGDLKSVRNDLQNLKVQKIVLLAHIDSFEKNIIAKAVIRNVDMQRQLDILAGNGKDVGALQLQLKDVDAKITALRSSLRIASSDVNTAGISDAKIAKTKQALTDAAQTMKIIYQTFATVAQKARSL